MGFDALVRNGVAMADRLTTDLQASVTHQSWTGYTDEGVPSYATAVTRKALVDWKQKQVRTLAGTVTVSRAEVTFLRPVVVDEKDRIVLPDGTTGPILDMAGFVDPATGVGYTTAVFLG